MSGSELRLVLIGWGAISRRVAALLSERRAAVRIVGVGLRDAARAQDLPQSAEVLSDPATLASIAADLVVEAAGRGSVTSWGRAALGAGCDFAVSSTSAFVDEALFAELLALAQARGAQLIIPPGALGGMDALSAAARLPLDTVCHQIIKPPAAWYGTGAEVLCDLAGLSAPVTFYEGSARDAADAFAQNANVAVISALAGIGLDRTQVALVADPSAVLNSHIVTAEGAFGRMTIRLDNRPLATNPKSSEMTALSLVRLIETRTGGLVI
ncbi:aspartate dehydrogenase [Cypionkella sp.]|uniref:aspartate dehydrogenase n=1 Tax=Cypionkella sp. TaxID=2811411 RepID=UPI002AB93209|nr:aspartate dehydrogenase [Cypionkella sp.]MDZ4391645.1 aspartate dehydrogenase [Cypionkella sp.]